MRRTAWTTRSPTARDKSRRPGTPAAWPLLVLAAPAAAEVWSGWVGIAQKTGFGMVSLLPGIWPALRVDTTITLPIGVEAYAAYAMRAWLSRDPGTSNRTHRFAKLSAICSFLLGMAGQIAYHLLSQSGAARALWLITTIVSCLPVLVLAMGTTLAHMLRADPDPALTGDIGHTSARSPEPVRTSKVERSSPAAKSAPDVRPDRRPRTEHALTIRSASGVCGPVRAIRPAARGGWRAG